MNYSYLASFIIVMLMLNPVPAILQESGENISDKDLELVETYLELAEGYFEENEFEIVLSFYKAILEIVPNNIDALNGMGLTLYSMDRYEEAISFYDKVLVIDPKNNDALVGRTLALDSLGTQEEKIPVSGEDLELLIEYLEKADNLFEEENFEEAILFYDKALAIDPTDFHALFVMAFSLDAIGKYGEAISYYDKILAIDPSYIDALDGRALALERIMNKEEPLSEISDEDLDLLEEYFEKADDLFREENFEEAILFYDKILAIDPLDIDALNGKAQALDNIGKHEEAITYYDAVLAIDPLDIDALNGKAQALHNIGKYEDAITYYDAVLGIDSTDDDALYGKALVLEALGRKAEAIPLLEQVIEQAPPVVEFREPPEGTVDQQGVNDIAELDQTLFVIVGVFIVILISIIVIDFILKARKPVIKFESPVFANPTILSQPSSSSISYNKEDNIKPEKIDYTTNPEVKKAIEVLQNLADMKLLDNPAAAKQFLLLRGFSEIAVKNAMISMGIDSI